ncbi:hypothetical protein [Pseudodonghicola flavimaris]|uniref:Flagellar FliJ protein n=1 Tax=Pseudodonghicola flavimaris TaxID=3050036 RepID=A0ABT7EWM2_9RHOB|nr:hypothetical protein [Pseudodonghicola flavimaris]MDK3016738.1 hypothetical protein [Pseudodonghicola flavimaris]
MPHRRRIAALQLIQRIRQHEIDGHAARMAVVRDEQTRLQAEIAALDTQVDAEGRVTTPETAAYLASFLRAAGARRAHLQTQLSKADRKAAALEHQLMEAFRDAKVNDTVLDQAQDRQQDHHDRQDRAATEEIARTVFLRTRRR